MLISGNNWGPLLVICGRKSELSIIFNQKTIFGLHIRLYFILSWKSELLICWHKIDIWALGPLLVIPRNMAKNSKSVEIELFYSLPTLTKSFWVENQVRGVKIIFLSFFSIFSKFWVFRVFVRVGLYTSGCGCKWIFGQNF